MADLKISQLTGASTPLAGTEVLPIVQSGVTKQVSVANLTAGRPVSGLSGTFVNTAGAASGNFSNTIFQDVNVNYYLAAGTTGNTVKLNFGENGTTNNIGSFTVYGSGYGSGLNSAMEFGNANGKVRVTTAGDVAATTGNFLIGTAGKGIDFSANGGDVLTQYDEGTWTPVATAQVGTITSYTSSGTYTRIGRQVTLMGTITITNVGTGSNGLRIGGLPFTYVNQIVLSGREVAINGKGLAGTGFGTGLIVTYADTTSPLATNAQFDFCITYFV